MRKLPVISLVIGENHSEWVLERKAPRKGKMCDLYRAVGGKSYIVLPEGSPFPANLGKVKGKGLDGDSDTMLG